MNAMSKSRLRLLFLGNRPRIENRQRGYRELGLVDWRPKGSSDKTCLNVLRIEDVNQIRARPSSKQDNEAGIGGDNKAGIGKNDKTGIKKQDNKAGTRRDNKMGIKRWDKKMGTKRQDNDGVGDPKQDNKTGIGKQDNQARPDDKRVAELVARTCHIKTQRLLHRIFLLAKHSNFFLTFSSLESVID